MQKFLVLLSIFLYATTLFAAYDVKIGVYKNAKNLRANIAKIKSTKYRKSIVIEKKNRLYYAHAILLSNKDARNALRAYKRVFDDAFIAKEQVGFPKVEKKRSLKSKQKKSKNVDIPSLNARTLLEHKRVYLCYDKSPNHLKKRVVQMDFDDEKVRYTPLFKGKIQLDIPYVFKDSKIVLNVSDINITHEISDKHDTYLSAKNISEGVTVYTLRYYFNKEEALEFVKRN